MLRSRTAASENKKKSYLKFVRENVSEDSDIVQALGEHGEGVEDINDSDDVSEIVVKVDENNAKVSESLDLELFRYKNDESVDIL